jgi:folate-binding protein YgfZ
MTFKTNLPPASCPALSGFGVLSISGPQAGAFLQAQLMNDVHALAPGEWQWSGWLTPKGRLIALFALLRVAEDHYLLVAPDRPAAELKGALQRFVFRSKLVMADAPGWIAAAGPTQATPAPNRIEGQPPGPMALDLGDPDQPRTLWLLPAGDAALAPADPAADDRWRARDLAYGLPRLPASQHEAWTPQMLSLDRLSAFSLKKGCYPGQEIVARTHYLGQAKRVLAGLHADAPLSEGALVRDGMAREVGTLVSVANRPGGASALAVLPADLAQDAVLESGPQLVRVPLRPGLAR